MVPEDATRLSAVVGAAEPTGAPRTARRLRRDRVVARRRQTFVRLLAATAVTLLAAVFLGGLLWLLTLGLMAGLGGYAVALRRWKVERDRAHAKVRRLQVHEERYAAPHEQSYAHPQARQEAVGIAVGGGGWRPVPTASHPDDPWESQSSVRIRRWDD